MALIYLYFVLAILVAIIAALRGRAWWRWLLIALFVTPLIAGLLVMVLPPEPREPVYGDEFAPGSSPQREAAPPDCTIRIIRMSGYHDRSGRMTSSSTAYVSGSLRATAWSIFKCRTANLS